MGLQKKAETYALATLLNDVKEFDYLFRDFAIDTP